MIKPSSGRYPSEASLGKSLCCHILQKMIHIGWRVVLSVDCTSEAKGLSSALVYWFFPIAAAPLMVLTANCICYSKYLSPGTDVRHDIPNDVHSWYLVQNATTRGAFKNFKKGLKKKDQEPDEDDDWKQFSKTTAWKKTENMIESEEEGNTCKILLNYLSLKVEKLKACQPLDLPKDKLVLMFMFQIFLFLFKQ